VITDRLSEYGFHTELRNYTTYKLLFYTAGYSLPTIVLMNKPDTPLVQRFVRSGAVQVVYADHPAFSGSRDHTYVFSRLVRLRETTYIIKDSDGICFAIHGSKKLDHSTRVLRAEEVHRVIEALALALVVCI